MRAQTVVALGAVVVVWLMVGSLAGASPVVHRGGKSSGLIAFVRDDGIYTMRADGSVVPSLLRGFRWRGGGDLAWSPDGRRLAFMNDGSIWVMNADGTGLSRLTPRLPGKFGLLVGWKSPTWSPDGKRIAYSFSARSQVDREVWVMNADGSSRHRLARTPGCSEVDVDWSPKGGRLIVTCTFGWGAKDLRLMTTNGRHGRTLLESERPNGTSAPDWSPDGRRIVFAEFEPNATALAVADAASGSVVRLTDMATGLKIDPVWSPDGRRIAFASLAKAGNGIYVMNADGTGLKPLTPGGSTDRSPAWQPVTAR